MDFLYCPGCMAKNFEAPVCHLCGWCAEDSASSSHHLKPGTMLQERYYVGRVLGQGGFGITYLGWDTTLDVKIAIKEYFPLSLVTRNPDTMEISCASTQSHADFTYGLEKFLDEARILASFNDSPNIVSARDFFKINGSAYMVMEYIEGIDLKQYLEQHGGTIPWDQAQSVIMFVLDALKDVHMAGLLHRDISPDNIFITNKGQIKVLDFGAARAALGVQNKSLSIMLKHGYAPVEQYQTRGNQGPWTDVYAIGATLYKCVTGHVPPESLSRLEEDTLVAPTDAGIPVSPLFESAVMKSLAVKAKDRFQSVQDFQAALKGEPYAENAAEATFQNAITTAAASPAFSNAAATVRYPGGNTRNAATVRADSISPAAQRKMPLVPILLFIGIILIGAGGYFMFAQGADKNTAKNVQPAAASQTQQNAVRPQPEPSPPVQPTAPAAVSQPTAPPAAAQPQPVKTPAAQPPKATPPAQPKPAQPKPAQPKPAPQADTNESAVIDFRGGNSREDAQKRLQQYINNN